jgi:hypothetical protein
VRPQDERDLRTVLRAEADRHEPDRAAMLRRIARARAAAPDGTMARVAAALRRPLAAVRPVAAAAAVTGVLVLAIAGIEVAGRSPAPSTPVAAPSSAPVTASPSPSPSLGGTAAPPAGHPSPHRHTSSLGPPAATSASASAARDGYLSAVPALDPHSTGSWAQSNLTVSTTERITALDVTIEVARTDGVAKTGHWSSIPADLTVQSVHTSAGSLLYRFTLRDGASLAPGSYTFAAQYDHADGTRSMAGDSWTATTAGSGAVRLSGGFS